MKHFYPSFNFCFKRKLLSSYAAFMLLCTALGNVSPANAQPCSSVSFAPAVSYASGGTGPLSVAIADFNGDGKPDLAVANRGPEFTPEAGNIGIFLNNGIGGFAPVVPFASGSIGPLSVVAGDFTGDGKTDLAVANLINLSNQGQVSILAGNGGGGFVPTGSLFPTGGIGPFSIAKADFNGDGKPDVAIANLSTDNVGVLLGNAVGGFLPATTYPAGDGPRIVATEDVTGDGKADLTLANQNTNDVSVLAGNGSGGFLPAVSYATGGANPISVATGQFNSDNKMDLVVAHLGSNTVSVLLNNGSGTFLPATPYPSGGTGPFSVTTADFNGDGKTDISLVNRTSNNAGVLLGNGSGGFAPVAVFPVGSGPRFVAAADLNNDSKIDLVTVNMDANNISVLLNNCISIAPTTWYRDFDGDGFGDPSRSVMAATQPAGYVSNNQDCNDYRTYYQDMDNDGWGNSTKLPCGTITRTGDCDDNNNKVHSLQTFYRDADGDSWGNAAMTTVVCSSVPPEGYVANRMDCNDNDRTIRYCPPSGTITSAGRLRLAEEGQRGTQLLLSAYPNPVKDITRIQYTLPADAVVSIRIFDVLGREVETLFNGRRSAGSHFAVYHTAGLSAGVYYCRMVTTVDGKVQMQSQKLVKVE